MRCNISFISILVHELKFRGTVAIDTAPNGFSSKLLSSIL